MIILFHYYGIFNVLTNRINNFRNITSLFLSTLIAAELAKGAINHRNQGTQLLNFSLFFFYFKQTLPHPKHKKRGVYSPPLVTTPQSHSIRVREAIKFLNNGMREVYVWVHNRSNMPMFCLKKHISQPAVQKSQFLEEMI